LAGNETYLHIMLPHPGESLHSFIPPRFTIPSLTSPMLLLLFVAFHLGVRDRRMLEKLAMQDIQDVIELFSLADKCIRPTNVCACVHHLPQRLGRLACLMRVLLFMVVGAPNAATAAAAVACGGSRPVQ
jgi:hypothetical protein